MKPSSGTLGEIVPATQSRGTTRVAVAESPSCRFDLVCFIVGAWTAELQEGDVPQIVVSRTGDSGALLRRMRIEVDGRVVARLYPGKTVAVEIESGRHMVQVRMDWMSSEPHAVELGDGDVIRFATRMPLSSIRYMFRGFETALDLREVGRT